MIICQLQKSCIAVIIKKTQITNKQIDLRGTDRFDGMEEKNILILSCGTRNKIAQYLKNALGDKGKLIATDCNKLAPNEIIEMVRLAEEAQLELVLAIGQRATTDTSASVNTPEGVRMGYRLRGQEQIVRAVEDVKRAVAFGYHSFLVYDEGPSLAFERDC